jgi:alanyl-tRNA synthetase
VAEIVIQKFGDFYPELKKQREVIFAELKKEEDKFSKTLETGLRELEKRLKKYLSNPEGNVLEGHEAFFKTDMAQLLFDLYQTYGFPLELAKEMLFEGLEGKGVKVRHEEVIEMYNTLFKKHQDLSRTASAGMFKGGLQDSGEETAKLHTAAHLLLASLRQVLGNHVLQKGSNITPDRLRLDFSHPAKVEPGQLAEVENLVNAAIEAKLDVVSEEMTLEAARKANAMGVFESKYGEKVTVYSVITGDSRIISREICGGPHAKNTGELGHFKIQKEEASSSGVRRIKAVLE